MGLKRRLAFVLVALVLPSIVAADGGSGDDAGEDPSSAVVVSGSFSANISTDPDVDLFVYTPGNETIFVEVSTNVPGLELNLSLLDSNETVLTTAQGGSSHLLSTVSGGEDVLIRVEGSGATGGYAVTIRVGPPQNDAGSGQDASYEPPEAEIVSSPVSAQMTPDDPGDLFLLDLAAGIYHLNLTAPPGTELLAGVVSGFTLLTFANPNGSRSDIGFELTSNTTVFMEVIYLAGEGGEYFFTFEATAGPDDGGAGRDAGIRTGEAVEITRSGNYTGFLAGNTELVDWADLYVIPVTVGDEVSITLTPSEASAGLLLVSIQTEPADGSNTLDLTEIAEPNEQGDLEASYVAELADERVYIAVSNEEGGLAGFYQMRVEIVEGELAFQDFALIAVICCGSGILLVAVFAFFIVGLRRSRARSSPSPYWGEPGRGFVVQPDFNTAFPAPGDAVLAPSEVARAQPLSEAVTTDTVPVGRPEDEGDFRPLSDMD